jgi:hypothetical protein
MARTGGIGVCGFPGRMSFILGRIIGPQQVVNPGCLCGIFIFSFDTRKGLWQLCVAMQGVCINTKPDRAEPGVQSLKFKVQRVGRAQARGLKFILLRPYLRRGYFGQEGHGGQEVQRAGKPPGAAYSRLFPLIFGYSRVAPPARLRSEIFLGKLPRTDGTYGTEGAPPSSGFFRLLPPSSGFFRLLPGGGGLWDE